MANTDHLDILRQGVEAWNKWKKENPYVQANLNGANLHRADLSGADLSRAILYGTDLSRAILRGADLNGADLREADLHGADLREANLYGTDLRASRRATYLWKTSHRPNTTQIAPKWRLVWEIVNGLAEKSVLYGADLREANLYGADLHEADLHGADLTAADLREADLTAADLHGADLRKVEMDDTTQIAPKWRLVWKIVNGLAEKSVLYGADLREANLYGADLHEADLHGADLTAADLREADLSRANLSGTNLHRANLQNTNLRGALLIQADLTEANLSSARIFGISAWGIKLKKTNQTDLIITDADEPTLTVDNLEVAQFIYLLLHNEKIREVIDTITSKAVLILGRFTPERKGVLDALREELRNHNYTPILFDFEKPNNRDLTETVMTLAGMARFVIADLSDPNSSPHEIMSFARQLLSVPIQAIFCPAPEHPNEYPMYKDLQRLPHVLPIYKYESQEELIAALGEKIIRPAEEKVKELRPSS